MFQTRFRQWTIAGILLLALFATVWARTEAAGGDLHYGDTTTGTLKAGASDLWHFAGTAGDVIAVTIQRTSGDLEPVLLLQDAVEQPVVGTQAASGQAAASLVQVRLAQSGSYLLKVSGNGQTAGDYRLALTLSTSSAPTVTPAATAATRVVAGTLNYGSTVRGQLDSKVFRQFWSFRGAFGDIVDIRMAATSGNLDAAVALLSPNGDIIAGNDSASGGTNAAIMAFQLPYTGQYTIIARRSGAAQGQGGTTSGGYELSISLRGVGTAAQNTALMLNMPMQGRLNEQVPQAIYRLEVGGMVAVQLDLSSMQRLGRVRFLNATGAILATYEGLSPLLVSTLLPDQGPFLIEVSTLSYENAPSTDFSVTAFRLSARTTSARPLAFGETRRVTAVAGEKWVFVGHAGDITALNVVPDTSSINASVRVTGPQDILVYQGDLGPGVRQALTLPDTGAYEVEIRPAAEDSALNYAVRLDRLGANGITFERYSLPGDQGPLPLNTTFNGTLAAGSADAWWLDATAGQVVNLIVNPVSGNASAGIALRRPDGSLAEVEVSQRNQAAVIHQAILDQTGRYRVVVFDSRGNVGGPYTLRSEEVSGGSLQPGQPSKGILSPASGLSVWALDATAGSLISARLTTLTPKAWTPSLAVAGPGGRIIASRVAQNAGADSLDLVGVEAPVTGRYFVVVAGQVTGTLASFDVLANVQSPFADGGSPVQVNAIGPVVGRYAPQPTDGPVQLSVTDLINPSLTDERVLATNATPLNAGSTVRGEIVRGTLVQAWRFTALHDATLSIQATSLAGSTGPDLTVLDENGKVIDEQLHAADPTTALTYRVGQSGTYAVAVRMGLEGGRYILSLNTVNVTNGPLQVSPGKPLVYGQTVPGEILNGDTSQAYYFLGSANDILSIQVNRATGDLAPAFQLQSLRGPTIASDLNPGSAAVVSASNVRLTENGIYSLVIRHGGKDTSTTGRYFVYLGLDSSARLQSQGSGLIEPGQSVSGSLSQADSEDTWLFQGRMGERVTFVASGLGSPLPAPLGLRLQDTAGRVFAMQDAALTQSAIRLADVMLPADGVYRIRVTGAAQSAGTYTLSWQPERERLIAGALNYNQTVNGVFTAQHNTDSWVFSGTAGDVVSISMRYQRGDPFKGGFQLRSENGLPLVTKADLGDGSGARVDGLLLPFSGSYTVTAANPDANFKGTGIYSLSVNLQDSKARSMGGILHAGEQGQGRLYQDDAGDTWVFEAQAGEVVRLSALAQDRFLKPSIELRTPTGALLASALAGDADSSIGQHAQAVVDKFAIQADGVYTVTITGGPNKTIGGYLLSLDVTPQAVAEAEIIRYGDTKEGLIANDRLRQVRLFAGTRGDSVTVKMTREPGSNLTPIVEMQTEDGRLLARTDAAGQESAVIADFKLPETGQYRLVSSRYLDEQGQTIGRYKVSLSSVPENRAVKGIVKYGQLAIGRLDNSTPADRITFVGKAGDVVGVSSRAKSGDLDTRLSLENSAGRVLATNDDPRGAGTTDAALFGVPLPADDTYTVVISRAAMGAAGSAGNYELYVNLLYQVNTTAAPKALIGYGQRVTGTVDGQNADAVYAFSGRQDDVVSVQLVHQTDDAPPLLYIQDSAGMALATGQLGVGQTTIDRYRLPTTGLYNVVVRRPINSQLNYSPFALTLSLSSSPSPQANAAAGGVLRTDDAVIGTFAPGQAAHYWLFQAQAGQVVSLNLLRLNGDLLPSIILIGPDGHGLVSAAVPERGQALAIDRVTLPADGLYSLLVLPGGSNPVGQYRLVLHADNNATPAPAVLAIGQTISGSLDAVQTEQRWSFDGKQGQTITARMLATGGNLSPRLMLVGADGHVLIEGRTERTPHGLSSAIIDFVLPTSGSYALLAVQQPDTIATAGTYRLGLEAGSLSPDAVAAEPIALSQPIRGVIQQGTTDLWIFTGAAGDTINVTAVADIDKNDSTSKAPGLALEDAGGRTLIEAEPTIRTETAIEGFTLPADGRYVVVMQAGSMVPYTLVVQRRQSLLATGISPRPLAPDRPLDSVITGKEAADYWSFAAKAGSVVQITGTRLSGDLRLDLALFGPSGYVASATAGPDGANFTLGPVRLPDEGSYVLVAARWLGAVGKTAGRYSVTLSYPSGVSGSTGGFIPVYGQAVSGGITASDAADEWTFDGQAGDVVNVQMTRLDADLAPDLKLILPDGKTQVASGAPTEGQSLISRVVLSVSGRYKVIAGRSGTTTGGYRLLVERVQTAIQASVNRAAGISYGEQRDGELTAEAPVQAWVFFGKAGDRVAVEAAPQSGSALDPYLYALSPDGTVLATDDNGGGGVNARLSSVQLPIDGFYGVIVAESPLHEADPHLGKFTLSLQRNQPGAAYQGRVTVGGAVDGALTEDQPIQEWTFEVTAARPVVVVVDSPSAMFDSVLSVVTADGRLLASSGPAKAGAASVDVTLPGPGQYAILVTASSRGAQGRYRLSLSDAVPLGAGE